MDVKRELRRPRGIGALVAVLGVVAGTAALVKRMMRRTKPWYERLGHTVTHDLHVPGGRRLRQLARR
ncbi:MAG: hypothetical protein ICV67_06240 [Thermoleophilia bacterium]|nr:hypothetical protein [Thermoleophilia bacterium]